MNAVLILRRRAFTLVEILTVVLIIGIAAAIVVPQIGSRDDLRAAAAARTLTADLIYAQNLAITQQSNVCVVFDTTDGTYTVTNPVTAQTLTHPLKKTPFVMQFGAGGSTGLKDTSLGEVQFFGSSATTVYTALGFDDLGSPLAYPDTGTPEALTSGHVRVQAGEFTLQIDVEPFTGHISVVAPH